jgi:hypothetical protein
MAMSSTAIVVKLMADRLELESEHGRRVMGAVHGRGATGKVADELAAQIGVPVQAERPTKAHHSRLRDAGLGGGFGNAQLRRQERALQDELRDFALRRAQALAGGRKAVNDHASLFC